MRRPGVRYYIQEIVLVRNVSIRGKQKLADRWEQHPYVVVRQVHSSTPVYEVRKEGTRFKKSRILHRNLLLPFMTIADGYNPETTFDDSSISEQQKKNLTSTETSNIVPKYVIPMRRSSSVTSPDQTTLTSSERPIRNRQTPQWMRRGDFVC